MLDDEQKQLEADLAASDDELADSIKAPEVPLAKPSKAKKDAGPPAAQDPPETTGTEEVIVPHGQMAETVYRMVNRLTEAGASRTEAFSQVAMELGKKAGTVSANYYRIARQQGETPSSTGEKRGRPKKSRIQVTFAGGEIAQAVAKMEKELEELRAFKASVLQMISK